MSRSSSPPSFTFHSKDQKKCLLNHPRRRIEQLRLSSSSFRFFLFLRTRFLSPSWSEFQRYRFLPVSLNTLENTLQQTIFHNFLFLSIPHLFFLSLLHSSFHISPIHIYLIMKKSDQSLSQLFPFLSYISFIYLYSFGFISFSNLISIISHFHKKKKKKTSSQSIFHHDSIFI